MRKLLLGIMLMILVFTAVPASAAVTKETKRETLVLYEEWDISPSTTDWCTIQVNTVYHIWYKDSVYWKADGNWVDVGNCDGGTTFQCSGEISEHRQNGQIALNTGNCWFYYLDGSKAHATLHWTFVRGDMKVDFWNWH